MIRKKIFYTLSKYIVYGLKFVQAMLIAKCLGPTGLAIYGFSQLISLYISFANFGIPVAVHALISVQSEDDFFVREKYINSGFTSILMIGATLCIFVGLVVFYYPFLFEKFEFYRYGIISSIIGVNLIIVQFFSNVYQVYSQYMRIAANEIISILTLLAVVFFFRGEQENLLYYTLFFSAGSIFINIFFFLFKAPFRINLSIKIDALKPIVKIGIPLLISNVGFYLIIVSVRTISSYIYPLHQIGLFTFGLNIANTALMGLNAMGWTYYSTIIANTSGDVEDAYLYIQNVNKIYNSILCITIYSIVLCLPVLFYFLPEYREFSDGISILLLTQIFTSLSFGYSSLMVAQKKQNKLAFISFSTLFITLLLSILVGVLKLPLMYQSIVVLISMAIYSLQICYEGAKVCGKSAYTVLLVEIFNYRILVSFIILLFVIFLNLGFLWTLTSVFVYFILSIRDIRELLKKLVKYNENSQ